MVTAAPIAEGPSASQWLERRVISIRRMSLGSGYRYLMESVAAGDGAPRESSLAAYYAASGTPPGVFLGAGLPALDDGRGVESGSEVTEQHLFNLLGMCADPVTGKPLGRAPLRSHLSLAKRVAERIAAIDTTDGERDEHVALIEAEERAREATLRAPVAGFDLTFSPSKSVSAAWALADPKTKSVIYDCHRRAIDIVLSYAEREVFHSRSGKSGVVQEDIEGVVATAFTHFDSRSGDPQLHDHVVVANRARSVSDSVWRTLDSRGLFKSAVMLSELHQGVLADLLTTELGWGWDGRARRHSDQLRFEVRGVGDALLAEFSQRSVAIEERKEALIAQFYATHGRQPSKVEVIRLRQRATLETRPRKEHRRLDLMTARWRWRAESHVGCDPESWVAELAQRNDLPLLRLSDLADEILADAGGVAVERVSERRATFSRANVLAEVHRQLGGVRFAYPEDRIAVAERTADLAISQSLLISAPELHSTPERLRRSDGSTRFRAKGHEVYTSATLLGAEARLLDAGNRKDGPVVGSGTVAAALAAADRPGVSRSLSLDQALAVERIATSGRRLDVLVGPAGTGKSRTMAGLRIAWEAEHGAGSVLGLAPSAAAAEVLAEQLGVDTENTAKWLFEHRREPERRAELADLGLELRFAPLTPARRSALDDRAKRIEAEMAQWSLHAEQLVIVDEASLAGTIALDELLSAAQVAEAKVVLVGDHRQLGAVDAGGMFAALVRVRGHHVVELSDVRRFANAWEKEASVELRAGSRQSIAAYETHGRVAGGDRDQMLDALYAAWKADTAAGKTSLMIAGDRDTVSELNARARADRVAAGTVAERGVALSGGGSAGVGDLVVTRQNNRRIAAGNRWVRNGDQWSVTGTHDDGSLTLRRVNGSGEVHLPADYVGRHVELAYASTAHQAQGRTVDTAHAMVSPSTTREALYVAATRGAESNRLYVDTCFEPERETSHGDGAEAMTARQILVGVLANGGAELTAHEMIRRQHDEAEAMERLSAEYLTLATVAQAERFESLLARSGLSEADLADVRASGARGALFAALRAVEARGVDVDAAVPLMVSVRSLADASDVALVLHTRVHRFNQASAARRQNTANLIAGLVPRAQGVTDPDMARALTERERAMERRALELAAEAIATGQSWVHKLGRVPREPTRRERWIRDVSTVAAYRERWHIEGPHPLGRVSDRGNLEQMDQRQRALAAARHAVASGRDVHGEQASPVWAAQVEELRRVEL